MALCVHFWEIQEQDCWSCPGHHSQGLHCYPGTYNLYKNPWEQGGMHGEGRCLQLCVKFPSLDYCTNCGTAQIRWAQPPWSCYAACIQKTLHRTRWIWDHFIKEQSLPRFFPVVGSSVRFYAQAHTLAKTTGDTGRVELNSPAHYSVSMIRRYCPEIVLADTPAPVTEKHRFGQL